MVFKKCKKPETMATKLHILPPSANSHGALATLRELGIENIEIVNAYGKTRAPEFLAMNPCHTCPTLEFGDGVAIWESCAIMRYLCRSIPSGDKLYPKDLKAAARIDMVCDWRQTSMYNCIPAIGYGIFGMEQSDEEAQKQFKNLIDEHFKTLTEVFLKDNKFCYSDTPTIADLAIAPSLTFIKARSKFWDAVPQEVKDYHARVLGSFPHTKENFDMLDTMCTEYSGAGADLSPLE